MFIALFIIAILFYLALTRPSVGLIAFLILSFSIPLDVIDAGSLGTATKIAGLGLAAGYFMRVILLDIKIDFTPVLLSSFFFLMMWRIFEASRSKGLEALDWIKSVQSLPEMVFQVILFFVLVVIITNVIKKEKDLLNVTQWMIYGITLSAGYSFLISLGIAEPMPEAVTNWEKAGRASGLRDNPNDFIAYNGLAIGLQLPFFMVLLNSSSKLLTKDFIVYSMLLMIMLYGQIMSGSRTGLLMIVVMGLTYISLNFRNLNYKRLSLVFAFLCFFILVIIFSGLVSLVNLLHLFDLPGLSNLFTGQNYVFDSSALHRLERQRIVLDMFAINPFIGIGLGNYELFMADTLGYGSSSHNFFVETLGEQGLVGIVLFFLFLGGIFRNLFKARRLYQLHKNHILITITEGFIISSAGLCFERLFSSAEVTTKIFYILFGLSYVVLKVAENKNKESRGLNLDARF